MKIWPSKKQWNSWHLPAKYSLIGLVMGAVALFLTIFIPLLLRETDSSQSNKPPRHITINPKTLTSPIHAQTKYLVEQMTQRLVQEKINPWLFMQDKEVSVTLHNGHSYSYHGFKFSGSTAEVFWNTLIDPFLEEHVLEMLDKVGGNAKRTTLIRPCLLKKQPHS